MGEQIRAARALVRIDQAELARRSRLSLETIKRLERIRGPVEANIRTLNAIKEVFQSLGITFESENTEGVVVRLTSPAAPLPSPQGRSSPSKKGPAELLHRLIFFSTASRDTVTLMRRALVDIGMISVARNLALGVTGALLARNGRFLAVLEGSKDAIQQIYGSISTDPRHSALHLVESRAVASRFFADWRLCCGIFLSDDQVFALEPAMADGLDVENLSPASALGILSVVRDLEDQCPRSDRGNPKTCALADQCLDRACVASFGKSIGV